jgi:hypothetical protein
MEIALRVLQRAVAAAGGSQQPIPLAGLEEVLAGLRHERAAGQWTVGRALVAREDRYILVQREPAREPLCRRMVSKVEDLVWDGRFRVEITSPLDQPLELGPVGEDALPLLRKLGGQAAGLPRASLVVIPALRFEDLIAAVPTLDLWPDAALRSRVRISFAGRMHHPARSVAGLVNDRLL